MIVKPPIPPVVSRPYARGARPAITQADDAAVDAAKNAKMPVSSATEATSGIADTALGVADKATMIGGMSILPVMAGQMAGGVLQTGGRWTRLGFVERAGSRISNFTEGLNHKTFSEVGKSTGLGGIFKRVTEPVFKGLSKATELLPESLKTNRESAHLGKAHTQLTRANYFAGKINLSDVPKEFHDHIDAMRKELSAPHAFNSERYNAAKKALEEVMQKSETKLPKEFSKHFGKMDELATNAILHHGDAKAWKNLSQTVEHAPKALAKTGALHGITNGAWIAGAGLSMIHDARGFQKNIRTLKQMTADMTGTTPDKISTMRVLLGDVPDSVRNARANILKLITVSELSDAAGMAINIKGARNPNWGFLKGMIAYSAPDWIAGWARSMAGETSLSVYDQFSAAYKTGQATPEIYAEFIGIASRDIKEHGGASSAFAQRIGAQFAAAKKSPAEILKAIDKGEVSVMIHDIIKANEAAKVAHSANHRTASHAEKLNKSEVTRPVIGEHTKNLAQAASKPLEQGI